MNKFDTTETTVAALTENKKSNCVVALTIGFYAAQAEGLSNREAYWKAEFTHFIQDHDGLSHSPDDFDLKDDEQVQQSVIDTLMETGDEDGKAEDRIDTVMKWYNFFRALGGDVYLSYRMSVTAGQEEWEDNNDLDEATAISTLETIPAESELDEELKSATIKIFYSERNKGNSVRGSLREALTQVKEAIELQMLFSSIDGSGDLGSIFGVGG